MTILFSLSTAKCKLLEILGKYYNYEIVVGMNLRVWINSSSVKQTLSIALILMECDKTLHVNEHLKLNIEDKHLYAFIQNYGQK